MTKTNKTATPTVRRVAILGGNRIPFARSNTVYSNASNQDMFTATLQGLVDRFNLHGERLGEVVGGAVMKHARDFNLVRESVLFSNVLVRSYSTIEQAVVLPDVQINRHCRLKKVVIDRHCVIPERTVIGEDAEADARRFHRTEGGVVLVTREMLDRL